MQAAMTAMNSTSAMMVMADISLDANRCRLIADD
jgi:hypothetical protein